MTLVSHILPHSLTDSSLIFLLAENFENFEPWQVPLLVLYYNHTSLCCNDGPALPLSGTNMSEVLGFGCFCPTFPPKTSCSTLLDQIVFQSVVFRTLIIIAIILSFGLPHPLPPSLAHTLTHTLLSHTPSQPPRRAPNA